MITEKAARATMRDWQAFVRARLHLTGVRPERAARLVNEVPGINRVAYDISSTYTGGATPQTFAGSADSASYVPTFLGFSPPPPGSLYSATSFQAAHFNFRATGTSATNLSIILNGGAYQIAPKM